MASWPTIWTTNSAPAEGLRTAEKGPPLNARASFRPCSRFSSRPRLVIISQYAAPFEPTLPKYASFRIVRRWHANCRC